MNLIIVFNTKTGIYIDNCFRRQPTGWKTGKNLHRFDQVVPANRPESSSAIFIVVTHCCYVGSSTMSKLERKHVNAPALWHLLHVNL